jgi:hypothetical protein
VTRTAEQLRLRVVPVDLDEANAVVAAWHRHLEPVRGYLWAHAVIDELGLVHGVAIVGRPSARAYDPRWTVEVTRCATDGTPNAPSALYGAAARTAKAMGRLRALTYTRSDEPGTSLLAAGWRLEAELTARGTWERTDTGRGRELELIGKRRWSRTLSDHAPRGITLPRPATDHVQGALL